MNDFNVRVEGRDTEPNAADQMMEAAMEGRIVDFTRGEIADLQQDFVNNLGPFGLNVQEAADRAVDNRTTGSRRTTTLAADLPVVGTVRGTVSTGVDPEGRADARVNDPNLDASVENPTERTLFTRGTSSEVFIEPNSNHRVLTDGGRLNFRTYDNATNTVSEEPIARIPNGAMLTLTGRVVSVRDRNTGENLPYVEATYNGQTAYVCGYFVDKNSQNFSE
jgi:hypothetical protein